MILSILNGKQPTNVRSLKGSLKGQTLWRQLWSKPYGEDCAPNKLECLGHVQRRVRSRLRKLKNSRKRHQLSDGKGLSG